ncbi:hypothetical protein ACWGJ9_09385 [Curtobacterium citreum]
MKLSTYRPAIALAVGITAIAALAGCSTGGGSSIEMPDGVTGKTAITTPAKLSKDLRFAIGRDDDFVKPEAQKQGARGAVVAVKNASDKDIKLGGSANLGEKANWGDAGDVSYADFQIVQSKLPKGCDDASLNSANSAYFSTSKGDSFTIKAGETVVGCTIITKSAGADADSVKVTLATEDGGNLEQTVKVGDLFAD